VSAPADIAALERENAYLKQRVTQLQDDVTNLSAEGNRLRQRLELVAERRAVPPDPLGRGR
jgi:cell division protein FtsB